MLPVTAGSLLLWLDAQAQAGKTGAPLPLDTAVRTGRLANGFRYFIRHNTTPEKRVVLYLVCKAGSILETEEQRGMAHFIEHMSFNGTTHFPKNALVDYLQKSGVRFGADLNAHTSFDETVYQLPLPSDNKTLLQNGLQIMCDWAQEATLDATEIEKERGVILEEARLNKGAQNRMRDQFLPVMMNHSRYAERMPIGKDSVLKYGKPETFRQFYHDWYRPNLQALIVVGDVDVKQIEAEVKKLFGNLANPKPEKPRVNYTIPLTGKNQFLAITDAEMTATTAEISIKLPGVQLRSEGDYRNAVMQQLLNQMLGHRFNEVGKQASPPFLSGGAGVQDFLNQLQLFAVNVSVDKGGLQKGISAAWREIERAKRFGFTETELQRAKQDYLGGMAAAWREKSKTNSEQYVKEYMQYFLHDIAAPGIDKEYQMTKELLPVITVADINALMQGLVKDTDRDIILKAPDSERGSLPAEATVTGWLQAVQQESLEAYKDAAVTKPLLAAEPVTGKIVSVRQLPEVGVTEYTLSNGVKVALKPTAFQKDEIGFAGFAAGGTSLYSDADYQSASGAAGIVSLSGVGEYSNTDLGKLLAGKQLTVSPFISERGQGINGRATPEDLETALQLVYLYSTAPRKDEALFQNLIARTQAGLANRSNDPNSVFGDTIAAVMGNYNIRRTGPTPEKLTQVNLERALAIYKELFADASGFTYLFVGNIDTAAIKPLLEKYLGGLPATYKQAAAKDLGIPIPKGVIEKNVYKGQEDKATVQLFFSGDYTWNETTNSELLALSKVLGIRLLERLREEEGGVYSPSAKVSMNKYPQAGYVFSVAFGCAPANADKLIASVQDELKKLREAGPAQVNLDKYKAEARTAITSSLQNNGFWMSYLSSQYQNQEPLTTVLAQQQLLDKMTVQSLQQAAAKYLTEKNFIRLVLLPEAAK